MGEKNNLERFKKDLEKLIELGSELEIAIYISLDDKKIMDQLKVKLGDRFDKITKNLPDFNSAYEAWYSESLVLLKQLLPDRLENFISLYEKPKGRKDISFGNYVMQDFLQGLRVTTGYGDIKVDMSSAVPQFKQQLRILIAVKQRFESSLFEIRQLVQADVFDTELESAKELCKKKFLRAAGVLSGVVLEKHLGQVCADHGLKVGKKNATINDFNELLKSSNVIEVPQWRRITLLGDLRNLCSHNKDTEPTVNDVEELIEGTSRILKTVF